MGSKKIIITLVLFCSWYCVHAQQVNKVTTWNLQKPVSDATSITTTTSTTDAQIVTQYLDGLGRSVQTVSKGITFLGKDLTAPIAYDIYGREQYKYLPYASPGTDGSYKTNALNEQQNFYSDNNTNSPIKGQGETYYYGQTDYEPSPLNHVQKVFAPGNSWVGSRLSSSEKSVEQQFAVNTSDEGVRIWTIDVAPGSLPVSTGAYSTGQLYKSITIDEAKNKVVEYKNEEDKVILKKVQVSQSPGSDHTGWLCTYYIYDDFNNLRCVIQPRGVELINGNWGLISDATILSEQCFRYEYDNRQRMVTKKVPGAAEVFLLYDQRDRLVYSQDGNMRSKNWWMTSLYDALNRPVATGIIVYSGTRQQLNDYLNNPSFDFGTSNPSMQGSSAVATSLSANLWVAGTTVYQASNSITFEPGFTSGDGANFTAEIVGAGTSSSNIIVAGNPIPSDANFTALTLTYYDNYNFSQKSFDPSDNIKLSAGTNNYAENVPSSKSQLTKGLVTGGKVWVLQDPNNLSNGKWLEAVTYYDDKGRPVQMQSDNYKEGLEKITTMYDFSGKAICNYAVHNNPASSLGTIRIKTNMDYDDGGRLLTITKQLNDNAGSNKIIVKNDFDELGQLKNKKLGTNPANPSQPLETLSYDYNIRGWTLGANRDFIKDANNTNYFGFELGYDKSAAVISGTNYTTPVYNGNISGTTWKTKGDNEKRKYDFSYDAVNRITGADFNQYNGGAFDKTALVDFTVSNLSYDANGNIITMVQKGLKFGSSPTIDDLSYAYFNNSNKLQAVSDPGADNKLGDFTDKNTTTTDYGYDANGNLITDLNKRLNGSIGIDQASGGAITYNHLNLPSQISVKDDNGNAKGTITYLYDAAGNKLQKTTVEINPAKTTTTAYINGFVYENDVLQFTGHEEGRIRYKSTNNTYAYDYFLKDHLGNVRMVLTDDPQQDIYPAATLETSKLATEQNYYDINTGQIADKSAASGIPDYQNNNGIVNPPPNAGFDNANSAKLYKLNSNTQKTGLGIALKVMSGDKIDIFGKSYYMQNTPDPGSSISVTDIITSLLGSPTGVASGKGSVSQITGSNGTSVPLGSFLTNNHTPATSNTPRAFINYILLDEQFKYVSGGVSPVNSNAYTLKDHFSELQNIAVTKNGYLYVYCSNESPVDVFFDNLQVVHTRGPILEETHYYPFGLTMAGISSKAANVTPNKEKTFQGQRFDDDLGLDWVQFKWRNHDPQIGRFIEIDPLAEDYVHNSTYAFSENKVTAHVELEGLEAASIHFPDNVTQSQKNDFYKGYEQSLTRGATAVGVVALAAVSILFPATIPYTAPVIAADLFGVPSPTAPTSMASTIISETKTLSTLERNVATGKKFEKTAENILAKDGHTAIAEQVTVKAGNGVKTRMDFISKDANGKIALTEAKGSATAPLTTNQKTAHPSIRETGGVIVGAGKPGYEGGTRIPPTQVNIIRPKFPL